MSDDDDDVLQAQWAQMTIAELSETIAIQDKEIERLDAEVLRLKTLCGEPVKQ